MLKPICFIFGAKINALTQSLPLFWGGGGKLYHHGVLYGIWCHFHPRVGGGVSPASVGKNIKMVLDFNF